MKRIIIVGSGIAGDEAAFAAKKTDPAANVVIVTKDPCPLYSACVLADYIADEIPREHVLLRKESDYSRAGIELLMSTEVTAWKPEKSAIYINDREMPYDKLILAMGSRTFIPPIPGIDKKGIYSLKNLSDADSIKKAKGDKAVVVGSGPVGIEAAIALRKRGFSVILIELLGHILPSIFDAPVSQSIKKLLEENGIEVHTGERLLEIIGKDNAEKIKTDKNTYNCDLLVVVAGMRPVVKLAGEEGPPLGETGGIFVNEKMETAVENVFACGDCVESGDRLSGKKGIYMLCNNARLQGKTAGINAAGGNLQYPGSINVTTVDIFNTGAAAIGTMAGKCSEDDIKIIHRQSHLGELRLIFRNNCLIGAQTLGRVDIIGGILKILLKKGIIGNSLNINRAMELWSLRNFKREIINTLNIKI